MALVNLTIAVVVMLGLVYKKKQLSTAILAATLVLLIIEGKAMVATPSVLRDFFFSYVTYSISFTILFICMMGHVMGEFGILDRMTSHLERILNSAKITLLLCPSLVGLLLVTGGAFMSCPMVDSLGDRLNLTNAKRATANLIFRHFLYLVYPLSTTLLFAAEIGQFNLTHLLILNSPIAFVMIGVGYFTLLKNIKDVHRDKSENGERIENIKKFLLYSLPITSAVLLTVIFNIEFYLTLPIGIIVALLINKKQGLIAKSKKPIGKILIEGINFEMLKVMWAILLFKSVIENATDIAAVTSEMLTMGIPIEVLIIIIGAITGYTMGTYQTSLAILIPILVSLGVGNSEMLLYVYLIYTVAFMAYLISPLHLCQILTCNYFKVTVGELYKEYRYFYPIVFASVFLWYAVLKFLILKV